MKSIRLHRIGLFSTFRFGLALGAVFSFLPAMLFTFLAFWGSTLLAGWLANLRSAIPLPGGVSIPVNTIDLLGLQNLFQVLMVIASMAAWQVAMFGVFFWLLTAVFTGLAGFIVAVLFNAVALLAGGIDLAVEDSAPQPGQDPPG